MDKLFERLYDYIELFNKNWKERIEPASRELIEEFIELTHVGEYAEKIPASYLKYLELMGEEDFYLISEMSCIGETTTGVSTLIEGLNRYEYEQELEKKRFPFSISPENGYIMFFDLAKENSEEVWYKSRTRIVRLSESFDKLMFQRVFDTMIHYKYTIYSTIIEGTAYMVKKDQNIGNRELYKEIIRKMENHGIKETWFSDPNYYRGEEEDIAISIEYYGDISCEIKSKSIEKLESIKEELTNIYSKYNLGERVVDYWN